MSRYTVGKDGIVLVGDGWGVRAYEHDKGDWSIVVDDSRLDEVVLRRSTRWDKDSKSIKLVPNVVALEVEYESYSDYGSTSRDTRYVDVPEEALCELLRRLGYEVRKP